MQARVEALVGATLVVTALLMRPTARRVRQVRTATMPWRLSRRTSCLARSPPLVALRSQARSSALSARRWNGHLGCPWRAGQRGAARCLAQG